MQPTLTSTFIKHANKSDYFLGTKVTLRWLVKQHQYKNEYINGLKNSFYAKAITALNDHMK